MMALLKEEQKKVLAKVSNSSVKGISTNSGSKKAGVNGELANFDLENILVEVFPPRQQSDAINADSDLGGSNTQQTDPDDDKAAIFTEINKAEPIKLLDLPGVAPKRTVSIIDHAASHFHNAYPAMFSASQKCRAPHLNLDNLRDALFASEVIGREKMGSGGELVKWMMTKNDELRARYNSDHGDAGTKEDGNSSSVGGKEAGKRNVSETALKKARKHDFYLGLESTWLYK